MTETAHDRLQTIASHTDLGAGIQVAMKDLEIRGAGNLLGGEQSGHIAGVGFDLYVRLVGEAVAEFRGDGETAPTEIKIELPVDAHLPARLRAGGAAAARGLQEARQRRRRGGSSADIEAELVDRYGPLPEPVPQPDRGGPAAHRGPGGRGRRHLRAGQLRAVRPGRRCAESAQLRLQRLYPKSLVKDTVHTILVPKPMTARVAGQPLRDTAVLQWASDLIRAVLLGSVADAARVGTGAGCGAGPVSVHLSRPWS